MVKEFLTSAIKKVTLDLIYQVVNDRTEEITTQIGELKKRQEEDFRYLVQKIDADIGSVRGEIGQLRSEVKNEIGQLRGEIGQLRSEMKIEIGQLQSDMKSEIGQLRSEVKNEIGQLKGEIGQLNQRIDTVIQMLVNISQKN